MSIDEILEEMDDILDKSAGVPFMSHRRIIDCDRMRELINDVRLNMPHELKEAKKIEFDCQRILNEAKISAESIIRRAEERAQQIVAKEAIVVEAKKKAIELLTKAQTASKTLQKNAIDSVNKIYNDAEAYYAKSLQEVKAVRNKLNSGN